MRTKLIYLVMIFGIVVSGIAADNEMGVAPLAVERSGAEVGADLGQQVPRCGPLATGAGGKLEFPDQRIATSSQFKQPVLCQSPAKPASCSGDDCGCWVGAEECREQCHLDCGGINTCSQMCVSGCNRAVLGCARACCSF